MLLSKEEYLLCPSCESKNISSRSSCWRCGDALPYHAASGLVLAHPRPVPAPWSQAEMNSLLSQAVLIDLTRRSGPSAARRRAFVGRALSVRSRTRRENQMVPVRHARTATLKRTTSALSLAALSIAAASVPVTSVSTKAAPHKSGAGRRASAAPASRHAHFHGRKTARPSALGAASETGKVGTRSAKLSLDAEAQKVQADLDARTRDFLTTGLNMVRDYEAVHGPVAPASDAARPGADAPYSAYIAHMKFLLIQKGVI